MPPISCRRLLRHAAFAAVVLGAPAWRARAQAPANFDAAEARVALNTALKQNRELQDQLAAEKKANDAMAAKVGVLTGEAGALREELSSLRTRAEALGPVGDTRGLEKRVLDALNDLRLLQKENAGLNTNWHALAEATAAYLRAGDDQKPALQGAVEAALALSVEKPAPVSAASPSARIESCRVVSVKPDQRLLVVNAGQSTGIKLGTPLRIYRNDRAMASAVVIEVRPHVAGTLITKVESEEFPKVGDTLRIDTRAQN